MDVFFCFAPKFILNLSLNQMGMFSDSLVDREVLNS